VSTTGLVRRVTPRGRHAPPLEVRLAHQRSRLLEAGIDLVETGDVRDVERMSAEAVSRHAGMSKATFYEHWSNIGEFKLDVCLELRQTAAGGGLHDVQHAAALCNLLVPDSFARQLAERLQQLGWTPPERKPA